MNTVAGAAVLIEWYRDPFVSKAYGFFVPVRGIALVGKYDPQVIEPKWQEFGERRERSASEDLTKPKFYASLSSLSIREGLHVGHPRPYTALDIVARKRRMQGYNVLFPIGWDAFGLPTENYAIKNKIHPRIVTERTLPVSNSSLNPRGFL